jgi:hypothetical protein
VLNEFYFNVTQKLKPGLKHRAAREAVKALLTWAPFTTDERTIETWEIQIAIASRFGTHSLWRAPLSTSANTC